MLKYQYFYRARFCLPLGRFYAQMKPVNPLVFVFVFQALYLESALPLPSHQAEKSQQKKRFNDAQVRGDGETLVEENPPFNCPGFGVFPHPTSCEWYYTCYFGDSVKLWTCKSDWLFDVNNEGCNLPQDTVCGDRERPGVEGTIISTNTDCSTTSPDDFICSDDGFFPFSPTLCCYEYFNCVGDQPYLARCPGNATFDPISLVCLPADQASCKPNQTRPELFLCPQPNGRFPIPNDDGGFDCHSFQTCINGIAYLQSCPSDFVYNPKLEICDYPLNVPDCL